MQTHEQVLLKVMNEAVDRQSAIKIFLEETAKSDKQLLESLKDKSKSLAKCWDYIVKKAKSELDGQSGYIKPSVVFGWAIHYFIETNEELEKEVGNLNVAEKQNNQDLKGKQIQSMTKTKKRKKEKSTSIQLDLFSMMEEVNQNDEMDEEEYEEDIDTTEE